MFLGSPEALWQEAFSRFHSIDRLKPWKWFKEVHSFAIHPRGYAEPFFIHPLGRRFNCDRGLVAVYGWNGNALFRETSVTAEPRHAATRMFEIPLVICGMRDKRYLAEMEIETARQFGTGEEKESQTAPNFASFRPGWLPWHLSQVEVQSTATVLNQALGVFLRAEEDISLIEQGGPSMIWVRRQNNSTGKWEEGWTRQRAFSEFGNGREFRLKDETIGKLLALPDTMPPISIDFDAVPHISVFSRDAVKVRGEDGRLPMGYFFAIQNFEDGGKPKAAALDSGVIYPASDLGSLPRFFHDILAKFFLKKKARPKEIIVSSERMRGILRPFQLQVPFKTVFHEDIPSYDMLLRFVESAVAKGAGKADPGADADAGAGDNPGAGEADAGADA